MTDDRYDRVTFRGHTFDRYTRQPLLRIEQLLGYELTIYQGSYSNAAASKGTHTGGGAGDLAPYQWQKKVRFLRVHGLDAWHRPELWIGGKLIWVEHIHFVQYGNRMCSPEAKAQVEDYNHYRNGLADHGPDPHGNLWVPNRAWRYYPQGLGYTQPSGDAAAVYADIAAQVGDVPDNLGLHFTEGFEPDIETLMAATRRPRA